MYSLAKPVRLCTGTCSPNTCLKNTRKTKKKQYSHTEEKVLKASRVRFPYGDREVTLETGRIARQADAAVLASLGDTVVLCTVVASKAPRPGASFLPLTVNYQEKTYAAGRIPGSFFRREGRPSEKETLTSRLIDRPIRPLFPKGFRHDVQVICTVVSSDKETNADIPALLGTSAALALSGRSLPGTHRCGARGAR